MNNVPIDIRFHFMYIYRYARSVHYHFNNDSVGIYKFSKI